MEQTIIQLWKFRFATLGREKNKKPLLDRETSAATKTTLAGRRILKLIQFFRLPLALNSPPQSQSSQVLAVGRHREVLRHGNHRQFTGSAIVDEEIPAHQRGYVRFRAGWWRARCDRALSLHPGEIVEVIGICEMTLIVRPRSSTTDRSLL